jgi:hypothetical protein
MSTRKLPGGKSGRRVGLTTLSPSVCLKMWEPQPLATLRASMAYTEINLPLFLRNVKHNQLLLRQKIGPSSCWFCGTAVSWSGYPGFAFWQQKVSANSFVIYHSSCKQLLSTVKYTAIFSLDMRVIHNRLFARILHIYRSGWVTATATCSVHSLLTFVIA